MAGSYIYTKYPDAIDTSNEIPIATDNVTQVDAEIVNRYREAILAIESELGVQPSGTYTTVKDRLNSLESSAGFITVQKTSTTIVGNVRTLNFTGSGVTVTEESATSAQINISGVGGTLSETLALGGSTSGQHITISDGDYVEFIGSAQAATTGTLRIAQGFSLSGRDNANSNNRTLLSWASDNLTIGHNSHDTIINGQSLTLAGFTWPNTDGTDGYVLTTDGAGNLSFQDKNVLATLSNYNELRNYSTLVGLPFVVMVLGRETVGDGGAGTFYWESTGTEDSGTIIASNISGVWKRVYSDEVYTAWFEGSDIGEQINAAYAALGVVNGATFQVSKTVRMPPGQHNFSTPIDLTSARWIRLQGAGRMETLLYFTGSSTTAISLISSAECTLENFRIIEQSGFLTCTLIRITGTTLSIKDVWVGNADIGIVFGNSSGNAGAIGTVRGLVSENSNYNVIVEGTGGPLVFDGLLCHGGYVENFLMRGNSKQVTLNGPVLQNGVSIFGLHQEAGRGLVINGGTIWNNSGGGILLDAANAGQTVISGTYFENNDGYAVEVNQELVAITAVSIRDTRGVGSKTQKGILVGSDGHNCIITAARDTGILGELITVDSLAEELIVNGFANVDLSGAQPSLGSFVGGTLIRDSATISSENKLWLVLPDESDIVEIKTGSIIDGYNVGISGIDIFKQKVGSDLQFRKVRASRITADDEVQVGLEFDITDYGGVCDSVTDNAPALVSLLADIQSYTANGSESSVQVIINFPAYRTKRYHFASQVTITQFKNIEFRSDGAEISCDGYYVFFVDAANGVRQWHTFKDLFFYQCGVEFDDSVAGFNEFDKCRFYQAPAAGIFIPSTSGTPGADGSVIGGRVANCRFDGCYNGIVVEGNQSDQWVVTDTWFVRGYQSDLVLWSTGWEIVRCDFEQRNTFLGGDLNQPFIQIRTGRVNIVGCRFGNEVGSGGNQPPKYAICIGDPNSSSSATYISYVYIDRCKFEGRGDTGPTTTSAYAAILYNSPPQNNVITRTNFYRSFYAGLIHLNHTNLRRGSGNVVEVKGEESVSLWVSQAKLVRGVGGWSIAGENFISPHGATARNLVDPELLNWTPTSNAVLTKDTDGPDGLINSAYTLTRTAANSCSISYQAPLVTTGNPITFTVWLRKPSGGTVDTAVVHVTYSGATPLTDFQNTITLTSVWKRYKLTITPPSSTLLTFAVYSGVFNDTDTSGDIEVGAVELVEGLAPSDHRAENFDETGEAALRLSPKLIGEGTAAAASASSVDGYLMLEDGWKYSVNVRITGIEDGYGYFLSHESTLEALRSVGESAVIIGQVVNEISTKYCDVSDGSIPLTSEANPADVTLNVSTGSNYLFFSVDNAGNFDLSSVNIYVSWDRVLI